MYLLSFSVIGTSAFAVGNKKGTGVCFVILIAVLLVV